MSTKKIIKLPKVIEITGLSKSTIYVLISRGEFPAQLKLSERASGWKESDIDAWIDSRQKGGAHPSSRPPIRDGEIMSDIIIEFSKAMEADGFNPPNKIEADGEIHRFNNGEKNGKLNGWYILYPDGISNGVYGDWRKEDVKHAWCSNKVNEPPTYQFINGDAEHE